MLALLTLLRRSAPRPLDISLLPAFLAWRWGHRFAPALEALDASPEVPAAPASADKLTPALAERAGCGWFDSSWDLHQGLAVTELPASDWPVAALWFGNKPRAQRGVAL